MVVVPLIQLTPRRWPENEISTFCQDAKINTTGSNPSGEFVNSTDWTTALLTNWP